MLIVKRLSVFACLCGVGGGEIPIEEQTSACDFYDNEIRDVWDNFIAPDMSHHNIRVTRTTRTAGV